ncbi:hypothetical protein SUBVAR_07367 [Subdoligranulum variabile DSM 15176]|uniref:Uncharacterized protein n=1 Tax=Subdoligranulum variabile DSM 15176 TaxID=411471 RepID=D1PSI5_9FIRM|nr:hypothetical protein SUBVAR_07367 [Subdoligranulum variabile DSM 15176]
MPGLYHFFLIFSHRNSFPVSKTDHIGRRTFRGQNAASFFLLFGVFLPGTVTVLLTFASYGKQPFPAEKRFPDTAGAVTAFAARQPTFWVQIFIRLQRPFGSQLLQALL